MAVVTDFMAEALSLAGQAMAAGEVPVGAIIVSPDGDIIALLDGADAVWLGSAQDHKRAFDGDKGPNTGGMGAISPSPFETDTLRAEVMENIIRPVAQGMADEGTPYRGILYAGLMLTKSGPQIIEFNCRFGDPEAQTILPRLKTDFLSALLTQAEGGLSHFDMQLLDDVA
ncbi:phosphoribosylamine--glycine ligase, partial [Alphaproteobacteria bacterium]|nr:phosphoribosylamine--glycine ligase [Alphaproteobacteria bacterium]